MVMSLERARDHFRKFGMEERILELTSSSATVELAAAALHCEPGRIAKTLSFKTKEGVILIVAAGDAKIDNKKFKDQFGQKAKMLDVQEAEGLVGHDIGGICPFGINPGIDVYLDLSLKRFQTVYPACGSSHSVIELSLEELEKCSNYKLWVDVCKGWNDPVGA